MVVAPTQLSRARDDDDDSGHDSDGGDWGPIQIATPAIVAVVLLLVFIVIIIIWRRRSVREHDRNDHKVRTGRVTKLTRMLVPRRTRQRVHRSSAPMTLDESMRVSRQYRSNSSDSQTPLTSTGYHFDYPPSHKLADSLPPDPKRRVVRWWWLFGSRPQEIKPQDPGSRWRVDGPDGSSTGHGHTNEDYRTRYVGYMQTMREDPDEADGGVGSTPMVQRAPPQARPVPWVTIVPPRPGSFVARTPPVSGVNTPQSHSSGPGSSARRGLPPSYDVSQSQHTLAWYPSAGQIAHLASPSHTVISPPLRTAAYASPHGFHGRNPSSDSFLAVQPPMTVVTSLY